MKTNYKFFFRPKNGDENKEKLLKESVCMYVCVCDSYMM